MSVQGSGAGGGTVEADREKWRAAVAAVLAKGTGRDAAELGPEPERLLDFPTYDGFAVRPLYTGLDADDEPPLPGHWPFTRGGDALRDVRSGWKVAEAFPVSDGTGPTAVSDGNDVVLGALVDGVSALVLRIGAGGCAVADVDRLLEGVSSSWCPSSSMGADYLAAADALLALVDGFGDDQRRTLSIDLGADPLTAALTDRPAPAFPDVVATVGRTVGYGGAVRALVVDGPTFHGLGASASWELAGALSAGVSYRRAR